MTRRLVILTEIISPYRIPLFNQLTRREGIELHVIFLAETDPDLRQWRVYKEEIKFSYQVLPSWRKRVVAHNVLLNRGVGRALGAAAPDAILCGGYNYFASWQALRWARSHGVPFLLWSESHAHESRRPRPAVEFLKDSFLRKCSGFVVPGRAAFEYLRDHRINDGIIFTAPNAVDNEFFSAGAAEARENAAMRRTDLDLPRRYFLFAGRLVREKGVFELLSAYAKLKEQVRREIGLVFVGDGESRKQLQAQAAAISSSSGVIKFAGFAHREQLAAYYGLAEMLILPTYSDTWGLVVNEAMACGLPVILSSAAGCGVDLVRDGWNGLTIPPRDVSSLAAAMESLASDPGLGATMGTNSAQHISRYSSLHWAHGIAGAIEVIGGDA
jgi:glycosyltransferase involved in cell wall biosynthesis